MENKSRLFDRRVVERYIHHGLVKAGEYQSHLKHLPDESDNAQWVQVDLDESEITDGVAGLSEDEDEIPDDDEELGEGSEA